MSDQPSCSRLRQACRELRVTVRISDLESEKLWERDEAATWITAHTERITFGKPYRRAGELRVDAVIHVPCRHLDSSADGSRARCRLYGYRSDMPRGSTPSAPRLRDGPGRYSLIHNGRRQFVEIHPRRRRGLPVLNGANPCATAQCRTSDNRIGAACCRDLRLELFLPEGHRQSEALLRSRQSPYLCRVEREDEDTVECEVISACGYLDSDGIGCALHDMARPNGRNAKPGLCYDWPDFGEDETGHRGCVFVKD